MESLYISVLRTQIRYVKHPLYYSNLPEAGAMAVVVKQCTQLMTLLRISPDNTSKIKKSKAKLITAIGSVNQIKSQLPEVQKRNYRKKYYFRSS